MRQRDREQGYVLITVVMTLFIVAAIALLLNRESAMSSNMTGSEIQVDQASYVAEAGFNHALWQTQNSNCTGYPNPITENFAAHSYTASVTPTQGSPVSISATGTLSIGTSRSMTRAGIAVYQPPAPTVVLQAGAEGNDTYISNRLAPNVNSNYGNNPKLRVGTGDTNALLKFDITSIPAGAKVISAQLALHFESADSIGSPEMSVHKATRPWLETETTWNIFATGQNWTNPGGDYDANVEAVTTITGAPATWYTWDVTEMVHGWVTGTTNDGLMVRVYSGNAINARFSSSDGTTATNHPKLTITYACECGVDCTPPPPPPSCDADFIPDTKISEYDTDPYGSSVIKDLTFMPEGVTFFGATVPAGGAWLSVDATDRTFYLNDITGTLLSNAPGSTGMGGVAYVSSGTWAGHIAASDFNNDDVRYYDKDGAMAGSFSLSGFGVGTPSGAAFIQTTITGTYDAHLAITDRSKNLVYITDQAGTLKTSLNLNAYASGLTDAAHIPNSDKLLVLDENKKAYSTSGTVGLAINPLTCDHVIGDDLEDKVIALNKATSCNADYIPDTKVNEFATDIYGSSVQKDLDYIPEGVEFFGVTAPSGGAWLSVDATDDLFYLNDMSGALLATTPGSIDMGGVAYVSTGIWAEHAAVVDFDAKDVRYFDKNGAMVSSFSLNGFPADTPSGAAFIDVTSSGTYDGHLAVTDRSKNLVYITDQAGTLKTSLNLNAYASGLTDVAHIPNSDKLLVLDENKKAYILAMDGTKTGEYDVPANTMCRRLALPEQWGLRSTR